MDQFELIVETCGAVYAINPVMAGHFEFAGLRIALARRPNWLHRKMARMLLGLTWVPA